MFVKPEVDVSVAGRRKKNREIDPWKKQLIKKKQATILAFVVYISRLLQKIKKSTLFVIDRILIPILLFVFYFFLENLLKNQKESSCHVVMDLLNLEPCPILVAPSDFSTNFYQVSKLNIINKLNHLPVESAHTMVPKPSMPLMAQLLTPHVLIKIHMKSHLLRRFVIIPRLSSISQVIFCDSIF